jgi:hypothetical protein
MVEELPRSSGAILGFQMSGRLHDQDYVKFVPIIESAVKQFGKVRMLAQFHDFRGWDPHALWDDIKFSAHHCHDVERIAIIGDRAWERWMAGVCKPFTKAKIQYFDVSQADLAWAWVEEATERIAAEQVMSTES